MRSLPVVGNNESSNCAPCGGKCCTNSPGIAHPNDFGAPDKTKMRAELRKRLDSGLWAIDWWEGDPRRGKSRVSSAEFVRPAEAGHEGRRRHGSWGGRCALLTDKGCSLTFEARPFQCRDLVPAKVLGNACEQASKIDKQALAVAWMPYRDLLAELGQSTGPRVAHGDDLFGSRRRA